MQSDLFHCKVTLRVSGVTAAAAASGTGHNIGTATSLQRRQVPIWPRWREAAAPIL